MICKYLHIIDRESAPRRAEKLAQPLSGKTEPRRPHLTDPNAPFNHHDQNPVFKPGVCSDLGWASGHHEHPETKHKNVVRSLSHERATGFYQMLKRTPDPQNIRKDGDKKEFCQ